MTQRPCYVCMLFLESVRRVKKEEKNDCETQSNSEREITEMTSNSSPSRINECHFIVDSSLKGHYHRTRAEVVFVVVWSLHSRLFMIHTFDTLYSPFARMFGSKTSSRLLTLSVACSTIVSSSD